MGQRYTDKELAQSKAKTERDEHAHARIDELQRAIAALEELHGHDPGPARGRMVEADRRAKKRLGL
jgi:hypothetical protein